MTAGIFGIEIDGEPPLTLSDGDAIIFCANRNHALRNLGAADAKALLVIAGVDRFNWHEERALLPPETTGGLTEEGEPIFEDEANRLPQ